MQWSRGRGGKGTGGDLWSYPLSLGAGKNGACFSQQGRGWGGGFAGKWQGVLMHTKHCFRKVSLAAVRDELMQEGTKEKVWPCLLCPQCCAGGYKEQEEKKQLFPPVLQGYKKEILHFL